MLSFSSCVNDTMVRRVVFLQTVLYVASRINQTVVFKWGLIVYSIRAHTSGEALTFLGDKDLHFALYRITVGLMRIV